MQVIGRNCFIILPFWAPRNESFPLNGVIQGLLAEPEVQNCYWGVGGNSTYDKRVPKHCILPVKSYLVLSSGEQSQLQHSTSLFTVPCSKLSTESQNQAEKKSPSALLSPLALMMLVLSLGLSQEEQCGGANLEKHSRLRCILMTRLRKK